MRSTKFTLLKKSATGWDAAVLLTETYLKGDRKADQLLEALPDDFIGERRAVCQSLFLGALRHGHRTREALKGLQRKKAKPTVEAVFLVTGYELLAADAERHPKIVHHAVERSKQQVNRFEQGFLNAVLRKLPEALVQFDANQHPAAFYSHPQWLVNRWKQEFPAHYKKLLEWNQTQPVNYLKFYEAPANTPTGLEPSVWPQFYTITKAASWKDDLRPLLNRGNAYIKDPSTRLAPQLLAPKPGESVLDLCAAPGGKAYDLTHAMERTGQIVALDLPGSRIERLEENLSTLRSDTMQCIIVEADLLTLDSADFAAKNLPQAYDAVMLDAPCSNTGVIQRRTDVKWRLKPGEIEACAQLQLKLLMAAAQFVQPGGRIVYSTCSIETAENKAVIDAFLKSTEGKDFTLADSAISLPWETRHDGAGAFLLQRR